MPLLILLSCDTNPTKPVPVTGVSLNHSSLTLEVGVSETLVATVEPSNTQNQDVLWSSSDDKIATITENGVVTGISKGFAIITVRTSEGGFTASCMVYLSDNVFTIVNTNQWYEAIDEIKAKGNDQSFLINIENDLVINGYEGPTFGDVENIYVILNGNKTISLSSEGNLLNINTKQNVIFNNLKLEGKKHLNVNSYRALVLISGYDAILTMQGSSLVMNSGSDGVQIKESGIFNMQDNTAIKNNYDGVSAIESGIFNMQHNSIISSNKTGVRVRNATFNMQDNASITNHESAVSISNDGVFNMSGGTIYKNITDIMRSGCAGVYVERSTFIMSGGSIYQNTTNAGQGGTIRSERSVFVMSGGSIYQNTSAHGAVTVSLDWNSSFFMSGGVIYGDRESGTPKDFANINTASGSIFTVVNDSIAQYGDGTNILPHTDGYETYTNQTIYGKEEL